MIIKKVWTYLFQHNTFYPKPIGSVYFNFILHNWICIVKICISIKHFLIISQRKHWENKFIESGSVMNLNERRLSFIYGIGQITLKTKDLTIIFLSVNLHFSPTGINLPQIITGFSETPIMSTFYIWSLVYLP